MWNPPLIDKATGTRRSALSEAAELLAELVSQGVRTICFLKSRRGIELIQRFAREELARARQAGAGGADRPLPRRLHAAAAARDRGAAGGGELLAVVATDALELGIDVGELDAAICVTFPGTVASLRQMWGRAGRRRRGLAVYVAGQDALDQFFCRHPDEFIGRPVEAAILDHESEQIAARHLVAAAYELPLSDEDDEVFGPGWRERAERLVGAGELRGAGGRLLPRSSEFVAAKIPLRSASADSVAVIERDSGEMLGLVEAERAFTTIHPGAIYLHLGRSYEVEQLDVGGRRAIVSALRRRLVHAAEKGDRDLHRAGARAAHDRGRRAALRRGLGDRAGDRLPAGLDLRPGADRRRRPRAARAAASSPRRSGTCCRTGSAAALPPDVLLGALHATEHGQIAVLPLIAMCDRWDIGGLSTNVHFQTGRSTIFIYDGHPGGVGITLRGYEQFERLLGDAERLIAECPCESGCPSCVQSPKCGNLNEPLHKAGALELMRAMKGAQ